MRQVYDNQTIANTSNGDNNKISTPTYGTHYSLIHHQSRVDSRTCLIPGQTPTTYLFFRQNKGCNTPGKTSRNGQSRHNRHHKRTQPWCTKPHTSTSGPLSRRRVTIHVEDHKPPEPIGGIQHTRLLRNHKDSLQLQRICAFAQSPRKVP